MMRPHRLLKFPQGTHGEQTVHDRALSAQQREFHTACTEDRQEGGGVELGQGLLCGRGLLGTLGFFFLGPLSLQGPKQAWLVCSMGT